MKGNGSIGIKVPQRKIMVLNIGEYILEGKMERVIDASGSLSFALKET